MNSYKHDNASAPGVAHPWTVKGSPVSDTGRPNSTASNVQPATGYSTAPYVSPAERKKKAKKCAHEGCRGSKMKTTDYCAGHARSLGLIENWGGKKKADAVDDAG